MVVGILDHQHGTRDLRRIPPRRARLGPACWPSPWWPRRRWPACRSRSASSPRRPPSRRSSTRASAAAMALAGHRRRLGPHRRPTACASSPACSGAWPTRRRRWRRDAPPSGRRSRARPRSRSSPPPPSSPSPPSCSASPPPCSTASSTRRRDALDAAVGAVHLALWHGFNLALVLSVVGPRRRRRRCSSPGDGVDRVLATGHRRARRPPTATSASLRGLNAVADRVTAVAQSGSLPVYLGVILLTAAVVPGALLLAGAWWPGWPDWSRPRCTCRSPPWSSAPPSPPRRAPALHRRPVPRRGRLRHGRAVRRPGRSRPGPHPGRHRDAHDRAVRARAAAPPRPLRVRRPARRRALRVVVATVVGGTVFVLAAGRRWRRPARPTVSDVMVARGLPGGRRPQRGQRDPRRLPRLRHPRRDHRAHRGGHRHGRPGPRRPSGPRPASAASTSTRGRPVARRPSR